MKYRTFTESFYREDIAANNVGSAKIELFDKLLARKRRRRVQALKRTDEATAPPYFAVIEFNDPASGNWIAFATADASSGQLLLKTMQTVQRAVRGRRVRARSIVDGRLLDLIA
jgi:hypothetical protein